MGAAPPRTPFEANDVFLYRAPLGGSPALPLPAAGPHDLGACAELLASVPADPLLAEALDLASPSLSALVRRVAERGAAGIKAGQLRRAALAVLRYDIRRRTRPTPFGLFAGVSTGHFDSTAKLERGPGHRTRTHVDMQWLTRLGHRLESDPAVLSVLTVQAHQALTVRGDRVVLTASSTQGVRLTEGGEARATVSVRRTPVVARALAESAAPLPYRELVRRTAEAFPGAPLDRIEALLAELVRQELLLTGLRPPLDGGDPLAHVLGLLAAVTDPAPETRRIHEALREIDDARRAYDDRPVGRGRAELERLLRLARSVEPDDTPLHIDTRLDTGLHLPYAVRGTVERAMGVMWRLSRPKLGLFALRDYHRRFLDVYGADRLVPVLDLLDESTGLGAPAGYGWPNSEAPPLPPEDPRTTRRDRAMARLVAAAQRTGAREVLLGDDEVAELCHDTADPADLQGSAEVTVQVVAPSVEALDDGEFRVYLSPSPGSHRAGATFARFADQHPAWGPAFAALHRDSPVHVQDAVPVDLAFRTRSGRAANLAHTVPATGRRIGVGVPDVPGGGVEELRLSDIGVGATLDRLTAVHLPTGREIVPVLGNMVSAPAQAPNAARLLWEIGLEGQRLWEPWNWGPLADVPFVPRIRYGRFVLACAVWRLDVLRTRAERLRAEGEKGGPTAGTPAARPRPEPRQGTTDGARKDATHRTPGAPRAAADPAARTTHTVEDRQPSAPADRPESRPSSPTDHPDALPRTDWDRAVDDWRADWGVPRHVLAVTTDQRLLLDLDDAWHRALLFDQVLRHPDLIAQEIPGEDEGWLDGTLAGHTSELVVPLTRRENGVPRRRPYAGHPQPDRTVHGLGGEWLYLKVHGSARTQDDLLRDHVPGMVSLAAEHGADRWFFIRYTDEAGHHLRLRLHAARPQQLWGQVAPAVGGLLDRWQREGLVRGHTVAQYDPETERYGGPAAQAAAERVFQHDSEAAVELLRVARDPANDFATDDLAVISCAALAHAFGPPSPGNPLATEDCGDDAAAAWLSMTGARRDLPTAFRTRAAHWRRLVDPHGGWPALAADPAGSRVLAALHARDRAVAELSDAVRRSGPTPEGRVVGSLLHMVCNRLFGGEGARELTVLGIARGAVQDHLNRRRHQS
ncbi:thiopeptide-type bacteriocin biosynthesis protein [Streptomyces sp. DSM 42143]|uniref:lantibiotic dehydratase n=1 Tax=Streptomyces sp. DSM 42143 TaxID=2817711 RepID=UPI0027881AB0|nr:lantibiotic dehydratase [Streptomyces sp. DSM 42143]MDQ0386222.1 thiopeptide-type bacteriocin biosynthesis protein [Streptomyces sp. DSM 42143]